MTIYQLVFTVLSFQGLLPFLWVPSKRAQFNFSHKKKSCGAVRSAGLLGRRSVVSLLLSTCVFTTFTKSSIGNVQHRLTVFSNYCSLKKFPDLFPSAISFSIVLFSSMSDCFEWNRNHVFFHLLCRVDSILWACNLLFPCPFIYVYVLQ